MAAVEQSTIATYLGNKTAVHRSFAVADNLSKVSAKAQIQTVCFDNLGLLLVAALNVMIKNNQRLQVALPFVVYPIFTSIDLYKIYRLKQVHLQTLTKDRLGVIIVTWIELGYVPSPSKVSKRDGFSVFSRKGMRDAFVDLKELKYGILLCLREGATADIMMGVLQERKVLESAINLFFLRTPGESMHPNMSIKV
ncbi:protein root UVB sensitive 4 [Tanacetum coccineum]|uniref:Protein root UVB sensitive 4 n=1 Tax=Tanacetum coccineum TaxID=301880 RepID=A0ABQ5DAH2_9ASTR